MDPKALSYLVSIVEYGGFSKAAASLHLTQSALSQAIHRLEAQIGTPLFVKVGRRAVLTEAGSALLGPARSVLTALAVAKKTMASRRDFESGSLVLCAPPALSISPLTLLISNFRKRYDRVTIGMYAAKTTDECLDAIQHGKAELGLVNRVPDQTLVTAHLVSSSKLVVILPAGTLAQGASECKASLSKVPFIGGTQGTRARALLEQMQAEGHRVHIAVDHPNRDAVVPLVLAGVGAAFVSSEVASIAQRLGAEVIDPSWSPSYPVYAIHLKGFLPPAARAFLQVNQLVAED